MLSFSQTKKIPVALAGLLTLSIVLSGCLAGDDFGTVRAPKWEPGYSWEWNMQTDFSYEGSEASGSSTNTQTMRKHVEGTAVLDDGTEAYIVTQGQGMGQIYGNNPVQLVSQDTNEQLAITWDELECDDDIYWRQTSGYNSGILPPLEFPLIAGNNWTMDWDGLQWEVEVLHERPVSTAAGDFDAVEVKLEALGPQDDWMVWDEEMFEEFEYTMNAWYSDEAREFVKIQAERFIIETHDEESVRLTHVLDIELESYSLEAEEGLILEDVRIDDPYRRSMMPPLMIASDKDMHLNSADQDTTMTFWLEERNDITMVRSSAEPAPSGGTAPSPVARVYEYPDDWDEDKLYWSVIATEGHWRFGGELVAEAQGAQITVELPIHGQFRVMVSDEPIEHEPPQQEEASYMMVPEVDGVQCSGAMRSSSFSQTTSVSVYFEDVYEIEQGPGEPQEIEVESFEMTGQNSQLYGLTLVDSPAAPFFADEGTLYAVSPDGTRYDLDAHWPLRIDEAGTWTVVWDVQGVNGVLAMGHTAEIELYLYPY